MKCNQVHFLIPYYIEILYKFQMLTITIPTHQKKNVLQVKVQVFVLLFMPYAWCIVYSDFNIFTGVCVHMFVHACVLWNLSGFLFSVFKMSLFILKIITVSHFFIVLYGIFVVVVDPFKYNCTN